MNPFFFSEEVLETEVMAQNSKYILMIFITMLSLLLFRNLQYLPYPRRKLLRTLFHQSLKVKENACSEKLLQNLNVTEVPKSRFSYDPGSKMIMCRTAKHGSSTWSNYFVKIYRNGTDYKGKVWITKKQYLMEDKIAPKEEKDKVLHELKSNPNHDFLSFFVCRNPVAKLMSTFGHHKTRFHLHDLNKGQNFITWEQFLIIASTRTL